MQLTPSTLFFALFFSSLSNFFSLTFACTVTQLVFIHFTLLHRYKFVPLRFLSPFLPLICPSIYEHKTHAPSIPCLMSYFYRAIQNDGWLYQEHDKWIKSGMGVRRKRDSFVEREKSRGKKERRNITIVSDTDLFLSLLSSLISISC